MYWVRIFHNWKCDQIYLYGITKDLLVFNLADVISKIKILEELARLGADDEVFSQAIDKLTRYKIEGLRRDLEEIDKLIFAFENKYDMDSEEFQSKYESGDLGDEMDYIEWSSLLDMKKRIEDRLGILTGA